jgi:thiosulfate reductase cytochrome b subunit
MESLGRFLVLLGVLLIILGLVLTLAGKIPWIGRLPGDIRVQRENFSFHFPIVTCVILSIILTLLLNLLGRR